MLNLDEEVIANRISVAEALKNVLIEYNAQNYGKLGKTPSKYAPVRKKDLQIQNNTQKDNVQRPVNDLSDYFAQKGYSSRNDFFERNGYYPPAGDY